VISFTSLVVRMKGKTMKYRVDKYMYYLSILNVPTRM